MCLISGYEIEPIENVLTVLIENILKLPLKREENGLKHQEAYL